jgi:glycosyltransferase involved in cell wall biosynthesis
MGAGSRGRLLMIEVGGRGGVTDYTVALLAALAADGWEIALATAEDHLYPAIEGVVVHPIFHYVRGHGRLARELRGHGLGWLANGLRFVLALGPLVRLARRADIVHTQGWEVPEVGLLAVLCMRLAGATIVQTSHSTFERSESFARAHRLMKRAATHLIARTIVHTQADLERMPPELRDRTVVIPHGEYGGLARTGGSAERELARAELGIAADAAVTLMFGQLRFDKGLGDLIESLLRLPDLHLIIGGEDLGALAELSAQLASPDLDGRITLREGFLDMTEAARLFAAADTVSLPYRAASQSGVLLLAYGFERPVIVYPVGGLAESVIDGETGWVCERSDVDALVAALAESIELGAEECLRRGRAGAALAAERFAWPAIARRTGEVYEQVLAAR